MILVDIRRYLENHQTATLNDLALCFDADPESIRDMLMLWVKKGRVKKLPVQAGCGNGCGQCHCSLGESYQWVPDFKACSEKSKGM
jgi:putative ferrous iron transport protein C